MPVFAGCSVLLELKKLPFQEKKRLHSALTENGGCVCYVVNQQCSLVVTSGIAALSPGRLRSIRKHGTPVVGAGYLERCLEEDALLPLEGHTLELPPLASSLPRPLLSLSSWGSPPTQQVSVVTWEKPVSQKAENQALDPGAEPQTGKGSEEANGKFFGKIRIYTEHDLNLPAYPEDFQVARYSIFKKAAGGVWSLLELQSGGGRYRLVWSQTKPQSQAEALQVRLVYPATSEEALQVYQRLRQQLQDQGFEAQQQLPTRSQGLGSAALHQLLLEEKLNTGSVSQEVGVFVEMLWTEALGRLGNILRVPVTSLSLNDVTRAEGLLLQAQRRLKEGGGGSEAGSAIAEVYTLLPHRERCPDLIDARLVSEKLDLCQLIRDLLNVSEMTSRHPSPFSVGKYRALRCSVEHVPRHSDDFQMVTALLGDREVQVLQVMRVSRWEELQMFRKDLGNIKLLLHSSAPSNFVGILSRGLLLPHVGVEHHGIERTDAGNLGSGIYFTDSMSCSLQYSRPAEADGSRLLLLCQVALGRCSELRSKMPALTRAPEGFHSVHGVPQTPSALSDFQDDEYVVYSSDQVMLGFVVQFTAEGDRLKQFPTSAVDSSTIPLSPPPLTHPGHPSEVMELENQRNPLDDVAAGLLDGAGQQLPLQAVHVKCKLMDLLSQVVIFQRYRNQSAAPIEAKYVFPLDDAAAVCGFEAFINGKHVVGQVKEKEQARREYRQAVRSGHGAYLMDQDAPDVFTISVGNLPPGATVLIKVTFVSELVVRDGRVDFSLPGSVAPWQRSAALNQTTQTTVDKVCVSELEAGLGEFTLDMSVEMPYEISELSCSTHKVKVKKTECKAVLSVVPGQGMDVDGFQLSITLSHLHLPRMWVERHPDKDSQACMLVFYPDFEPGPGSDSGPGEVVILLDSSESMMGSELLSARSLALQVLKSLDPDTRTNVLWFGTEHTEMFLSAQTLGENLEAAREFIRSQRPVGGRTELWRPLRALSLLPPSRGLRNLLLLSDGHIQNPELTLRLLREHVGHTRLFSCGLGSTANRHMLRTLAQEGGGAYEFFDLKKKHTWVEKVASQVGRMASPGCTSLAVKWQQFNPAAPPAVQAPHQLHALFSGCHALVYGFVPHCTQATLRGSLSGQEVDVVVSTSELQKTTGTFLHKLTARAVIRDYEDGNLHLNEAEHEGRKAELKSFIIELSKEFSILSQFTSFVAIEERDPGDSAAEQGTDVAELLAEEDVDFLPYVGWEEEDEEEEEDVQMASLDSGSSWCFHSLCNDSSMVELLVPAKEELYGYYASPPAAPLGLQPPVCPFTSAAFAAPQATAIASPGAAPPTLNKGFLARTPQWAPQGSVSYRGHSPVRKGWSVEACFQANAQPHAPIIKSAAPPPPLFMSPAPPPPPPPFMSPAPPPPPPFMSPAPPPPPPFMSPAPPPPPPPFMSPAPPPPPPPFMSPAPPPPPPFMSPAPPPPPLFLPGFGGVSESARGPAQSPGGWRFKARSPATPTSGPLMSACGFDQQARAPSPPDLVHRDEVEVQALGSAWRRLSYIPTSAVFSVEDRREQRGWRRSHFCGMGMVGTEEELHGCTLKKKALPPVISRVEVADEEHEEEEEDSTEEGEDSSEEEMEEVDSSEEEVKEVDSSEEEVEEEEEEVEVEEVDSSEEEEEEEEKEEEVEVEEVDSSEEEEEEDEETCVVPTPSHKDSKHKWMKIFQLQHSDGYWSCTAELGRLLKVQIDAFANDFLKDKGICSLGARAHADILQLVATLLVLQLLRVEEVEEGRLLQSLFHLEEGAPPRSQRWRAVQAAVRWARWADAQYPSIYSRLEFGLSWEAWTRYILGPDAPGGWRTPGTPWSPRRVGRGPLGGAVSLQHHRALSIV